MYTIFHRYTPQKMPSGSKIQLNDSLGDYGHFEPLRTGSQLQSDWEVSSGMLIEAAQLRIECQALIGVVPA
jgi:hypothetical protein